MATYEVTSPSRSVYITSETPSSSSLFNDIQRAYSRLTKSPLALTLLILGILAIIAESNSKDGPFEILQKSLEAYQKGTGLPVIFTTIASLLLGIVKFIILHKKTVFLLMLVAVIPLTYNNTSVTFTTISLIIYVFITNHTQLISVLVIQLVFIFYSLTEFIWRIVDFILIIYVVFGVDNVTSMLSSK